MQLPAPVLATLLVGTSTISWIFGAYCDFNITQIHKDLAGCHANLEGCLGQHQESRGQRDNVTESKDIWKSLCLGSESEHAELLNKHFGQCTKFN